jgi:hypothetical protein
LRRVAVHLSEHDIGSLLHGEATLPMFVDHLAACADCTQKVRAARVADRITGERLAFLDHSVPQVSARSVMIPPKQQWPLRQIAAGVTLLFLAVGAASALPGSPFHGVLVRAVAALRPHESSNAALSKGVAPGHDAGGRPDTNSGVLFVPDSSLDVVFRQVQDSGTIRVTFVNESLASVNSLGGSRSFDLGQRQVVANNAASSGSYSISIPVTLRRVVIRIGPDTVFTRAGADIMTVGRMDGRGSFTLPLSAAERKSLTTYRIH